MTVTPSPIPPGSLHPPAVLYNSPVASIVPAAASSKEQAHPTPKSTATHSGTPSGLHTPTSESEASYPPPNPTTMQSQGASSVAGLAPKAIPAPQTSDPPPPPSSADPRLSPEQLALIQQLASMGTPASELSRLATTMATGGGSDRSQVQGEDDGMTLPPPSYHGHARHTPFDDVL
jgi:hypothetical protein